MEENVLSQGVDEVHVIKEMLVSLNECKERWDFLEVEEKRSEKNIAGKIKLIQEETISTIKKRKDEIEAAYNDQLDKTKIKIKKTRSKKEKSKSVKVNERIQIETKDLNEEYHVLRQNWLGTVKENKIPSICKFNLFYSLYMPKYFSDFLSIFIVLLFLLYLIPCGIYFLLLTDQRIIYLVGIYSGVVMIPGSIYMLIENTVKDKYISYLKEIQILRGKMKANQKEKKKIIRKIGKDKDESVYDLNNFDEMIDSLNKELNSIDIEKGESLKVFEEQTKLVIGNEIKGRHEEELNQLESALKSAQKEKKEIEERIKTISLHIANTYEVYLGKEMMNLEKLDKLSDLMKEKQLSTISEGLTAMEEEGKQ